MNMSYERGNPIFFDKMGFPLSNSHLPQKNDQREFHPFGNPDFFVAFELSESYAMFNTAVTVCFILFQEGLGFRLCLWHPLLCLRIGRLCKRLGLGCSLR